MIFTLIIVSFDINYFANIFTLIFTQLLPDPSITTLFLLINISISVHTNFQYVAWHIVILILYILEGNFSVKFLNYVSKFFCSYLLFNLGAL